MAAAELRPLILICDDERPLRELIKAVLGERYRYVEAANAVQAEAALSTQAPAAIVLDVMLPGRSGIDFLLGFRSAGGEAIPVVVVSAWQSEEQRRVALGAGADAFLGKPFDPKELFAVVESLLAA